MAKGSRKKRGRKRKNRRRDKSKYTGLINKVKANKSLSVDDIDFEMNSEMKMSEIILDFAKPFLEMAHTEVDFRKGVGLAILAWAPSDPRRAGRTRG